MPVDSKKLIKFRSERMGKTVSLNGVQARVYGVCDDGARCDHDARRRFRPTRELIVVSEDGETHYWLADLVEIVA